MISPESRTREWITFVSKKYRISDVALLEKTIRAFSLLEALARSGCPFIFKGGSCLMLHFNTEKRLSVDIDIICAPGTDVERYIGMYANDYGFEKPELVNRKSRFNVPKMHAKYNYQVAYNGSRSDYVLLDVLLEDSPYKQVENKAVQSPFLKIEGENVWVNVPSKSDILGDKLAALAPNTTGIPYFKKDMAGNDRDCSLEIMKQLFDVASLFDSLDNFENVFEVYKKNASVELDYRNLKIGVEDVLMDSINTALCIGTNGYSDKERFSLLNHGVPKLQSFVYGNRYGLSNAVVDSSKIAYLSACLLKGFFVPEKYTSANAKNLAEVKIEASVGSDLAVWTKLNKLKKSNPEAFYYWFRAFELLKS